MLSLVAVLSVEPLDRWDYSKFFCFSALGVFKFNAGIFCCIPNHVSVGMVAPSNEHRCDAPKAPGPSHKADGADLIEIASVPYKVANFESFHLALCRSVVLSVEQLKRSDYSRFFLFLSSRSFEFKAGISQCIPNHISVGMVEPSDDHKASVFVLDFDHKASTLVRAVLVKVVVVLYKVANLKLFHLAPCRSVP
jgi:hypothetical protein